MVDEQYARFPSTQDCPREDCLATGAPFTLDSENYGGELRVVWSCSEGHVFTTDLAGQDAQS